MTTQASFCTQCGSPLEATSTFCQQCGSPTTGAEVPAAEARPPVVEAPPSAAEPPAGTSWIPPYAGSPSAPSPRPGGTLSGGTRPPGAPPPSVPYGAAPFATPNGVPTDGALANWGTRAGGLLLDGALLFAAALPFLLIGLVVPFLFFLGLLVGIAGGIYFGAQIGETGQSPGMRVVGVKCVHQQTGQIIGSGAGILRWLASSLNSLICYVGWLFPLWDTQHQTLADKIMTTVVVNVPKQNFSLLPPT
jgi:uncharacterized RDD family membrane protein YckC